jgi:putative ABC transport system ATP-binding protein
VRNASKIYRGGQSEVVALGEVTLSLAAGEVTGILGPSGSGKTTFLLIAGLLEPPTKGEVRFLDQVISEPRTQLNRLRDLRRKQIGFVFQKGQLIPFLTATENVQVAMEINDTVGKVARTRAHELLGQFGMSGRINNYPGQLSGGEQQRVSIARALANEPAVLLADEPTAALDGPRGHQVMKLFRELADKRNVAVCVVTHDPRWSPFFDRIARLSDGRLVEYLEQDRTAEQATA